MSDQPITVLYDGDCGICRWSRDFAATHDTQSRLQFLPFQLADLDALSPGLTHDQASRMAWAILPDGTRYGGARAVFEVLKRLRGIWRIIGWLGANPIISAILTPPYRLIAAQRHRISAHLGLNACALPQTSPHLQPEPSPVRATTDDHNTEASICPCKAGHDWRRSAAPAALCLLPLP